MFLAPRPTVWADGESTKSGSPQTSASKKKSDKPSINNHQRLKRDTKGDPVALQTSIARYVPASGDGKLIVDLIGVVHIGDPAYYEYLKRHFEQYLDQGSQSIGHSCVSERAR